MVAAVAAGYSGSARSATSGRHAAPVVVVRTRRLQGVRHARLHHRVGSAAAGRDPAPDRADLARDDLGARAAGLEGRPATRSATSRVTTRPRRPAGGTRRSARRTARLYAREQVGDRRRRNVQLRLREDHRADPQPCAPGPWRWSARRTRTPA